VGEDGGDHVDTQTAEEEEEEWDPGHILDEGGDDASLAETILQDGITDIPQTREHNGTCQPNFETVHVVSIDVHHPSEEEVIENGESSRAGDTVVGEHV